MQQLKINIFSSSLSKRIYSGIFIGVCISFFFPFHSNGTGFYCRAYPSFRGHILPGGCRIGFLPVIIECRNFSPCMQCVIYSYLWVLRLFFFLLPRGLLYFPIFPWVQPYQIHEDNQEHPLSFDTNCLCTGHRTHNKSQKGFFADRRLKIVSLLLAFR